MTFSLNLMLMLVQLPNVSKKPHNGTSTHNWIRTRSLLLPLSSIFPQHLPNFIPTQVLSLSAIALKKPPTAYVKMNNFEGSVYLHMKQPSGGLNCKQGHELYFVSAPHC